MATETLPGYAVTQLLWEVDVRMIVTTLVVAVGLVATVPAQADFKSGAQAYNSGD